MFYEGEKCDCGRIIPVHVERLKLKPTPQLKKFEYGIEIVQEEKEPEYGVYSFHKEMLKVDPALKP